MPTFNRMLTRGHILAGVSGLLSGLANIIVRPKGGHWHPLAGKLYLAGMTTIFLASINIITMFRVNLFQWFIAILSRYECFGSDRIVVGLKEQGLFYAVPPVVDRYWIMHNT